MLVRVPLHRPFTENSKKITARSVVIGTCIINYLIDLLIDSRWLGTCERQREGVSH